MVDGQVVLEADLGDAEDSIDFGDVAFDLRREALLCGYLPHFQCGGESAEQSASNARDHVIERCGILRPWKLGAVFFLVEVSDAPMDAEVEWLIETLDPGGAVGARMLPDKDTAGVRDGHGDVSGLNVILDVDRHPARVPARCQTCPGSTESCGVAGLLPRNGRVSRDTRRAQPVKKSSTNVAVVGRKSAVSTVETASPPMTTSAMEK